MRIASVSHTMHIMWGNSLGWCISAIWAAAVITAVATVHSLVKHTSSPTKFARDPQNNVLIELPIAPRAVLSNVVDATDAGPIYRRAIAEYQKQRLDYHEFARAGRLRDLNSIPAINILLEAAACGRGLIFSSDPGQVVTYSNSRPELEALQALAACARRAGQLIQKDNPPHALRLYEAVFALGARLYEERLCYAELDAGLTMLAETAPLIAEVCEAGDEQPRARLARDFDQARRRYVTQRLLPMMRVIASADQSVLERHAGDVFHFARHHGDRMWRVEAILKLGRYRFNAGRPADQIGAMRLLRELCDDPDPVIRAAAVAGRDLTIEQYRLLR